MDDALYEVDLDVLPARPVRRARMLLDLFDRGRHRVVVLDADTGEWVLPPGVQGSGRPPALSPDGTAVALLVGPYPHRLVWCTLQTGQRRELPRSRGVFDHAVAVSPDGRALATNSTGPDHSDLDSVAAIDLVDLAGGQRRRLWQESGGWVNESAVAFSPDGALLAVTYYDADGEWATAVVDSAGAVVRRYPDTYLPRSANTAWTAGGHLLFTDGEGSVVLADVRAGTIRNLGERSVPSLGTWHDAIVVGLANRTGHCIGLAMEDAMTGRRRSLATIRPPTAFLDGFDMAVRR
jgi:Tol biopolymer transport system component